MATNTMRVKLWLTDAHYRRLQRLAREAGVTVPTMCQRLIRLAMKEARGELKKKQRG